MTAGGTGAQLKVGPFGATTARVTNAEFGTDVIETPVTRNPRQPWGGSGSGSTRPSSSHDGRGREAAAPPSADGPNMNAPAQTQQNRSETEDEWPGTVYDMSDEDEVR